MPLSLAEKGVRCVPPSHVAGWSRGHLAGFQMATWPSGYVDMRLYVATWLRKHPEPARSDVSRRPLVQGEGAVRAALNENKAPKGWCCEYMVHNRSVITYALLAPPPGRPPGAPVPRVDRYSIGVDPSKRSAP
eukprot:447731-Prymnesium_polylepis.1